MTEKVVSVPAKPVDATTAGGASPTVVDQGTSPWVVSGTITANQGGAWSVAATQSGGWVVSVAGAVAVIQSTSPWVISGTVAVTQSTSPWVVSGTVATTQSGTWTTARSWNLASGTDSVAAIQSGTWNVTNVSGTVSLPTGASTATNQTTANTSLASIDTKTLTAGQKTMANSSPVVIASDQSTLPTSPGFSTIQTYGAVADDLASAATATDIFTITGSGTKTIKIARLIVSCSATNNINIDLAIVKRSTANTGGTSTTPTAVPFDSANAAATATVRAYTANPTLGTTVGTVLSQQLFVSGGTTQPIANAIFDFTSTVSQPIVLRGTGEVLALNLQGVTVTGPQFQVSIEWVEV